MKSNKILSYIAITIFCISCTLTPENSVNSKEKGTREVTNVNNPNLTINTEFLDKDYNLCFDGVFLGVVKPDKEYNIRIDIPDDRLASLWLVEKALDNTVTNSSYRWVTKIYLNNIIRKWTPGSETREDSGSITFKPPLLFPKSCEYIEGYLNNNESVAPIALVSRLDTDGLKTDIDYTIININWKFYNDQSQLLYEIEDDFLFTEDDNNTIKYIPEPIEKKISLIIENRSSNIIYTELNGKPVEESMANIKSGYSYIESKSVRTIRELKIEDLNRLEFFINNSLLTDKAFTDNSHILHVLINEDRSITVNDIYEPNQIVNLSNLILSDNFNKEDSFYINDRFENSYSALILNSDNPEILYSSSELSGLDQYTISLWIKPLEDKESLIFKVYDSYYTSTWMEVGINSDNTLYLHYRNQLYSSFDTILDSGSNALSIGEWQLVTVTKNNNEIFIYLNEELVGSKTFNTIDNLGNRIQIGDGTFNGIIDSLRVYNRDLGSYEIRTIYSEFGYWIN